jgi:hypothetical protein
MRCAAVYPFATGQELNKEDGGEAAAEMEAALRRHSCTTWYPEAR